MSEAVAAREIVVNLENVTFGEIEKLMAGTASMTLKDQLDILDRVVVGGVRNLPISLKDQIMEAIRKAVAGDDPAGKV